VNGAETRPARACSTCERSAEILAAMGYRGTKAL
jgi:hypothetical protein